MPSASKEIKAGIADLKILGDIKKCLAESSLQGDFDLAEWIQDTFLFEPIEKKDDGRPIETAEEFSKLLAAHKRVQVLSGRAQDKWPFFDQNWKEIKQAVVKKNGAGYQPEPPKSGMQLRKRKVEEVEGDQETAEPISKRPRRKVANYGTKGKEKVGVKVEPNAEKELQQEDEVPLVLAADDPSVDTSLDDFPPPKLIRMAYENWKANQKAIEEALERAKNPQPRRRRLQKPALRVEETTTAEAGPRRSARNAAKAAKKK